jgi:hypothetical protein
MLEVRKACRAIPIILHLSKPDRVSCAACVALPAVRLRRSPCSSVPGDAADDPATALGAPVGPRHLSRSPAFIDEHKLCRIECRLIVRPLRPCVSDIRPLWFGRAHAL